MYIVWHKERKKYVGKKLRGWPRPRVLTTNTNEAQIYKSIGAIKNSLGKNTSNIPGKNKKILPEWVEIVPISIFLDKNI